jgi:hypothetical protein
MGVLNKLISGALEKHPKQPLRLFRLGKLFDEIRSYCYTLGMSRRIELASSVTVLKLPASYFSIACQMKDDISMTAWQDEIDGYRLVRSSGQTPSEAELEARRRQITRSFELFFPENIYVKAWSPHKLHNGFSPAYHIQLADNDAIEHQFSLTEIHPDIMRIDFEYYKITGKLPMAVALFKHVSSLSSLDSKRLRGNVTGAEDESDAITGIIHLNARESGLFEVVHVFQRFADYGFNGRPH